MSSRSGAWWGGKWISSRFKLQPEANRRALYMPGPANTRHGPLALPGQQHRFGMFEGLRRTVDHDNIALAQLSATLRLTPRDPLAPHRREAHVRPRASAASSAIGYRPKRRAAARSSAAPPERVRIIGDAGTVVAKDMAQGRALRFADCPTVRITLPTARSAASAPGETSTQARLEGFRNHFGDAGRHQFSQAGRPECAPVTSASARTRRPASRRASPREPPDPPESSR